jgi:hypothetical protein
VSLQIAILTVLVSHAEDRATIAALNSDLCILNTSGSDWTDRLRRLAARAPGLDIFGQRLILRDSSGWQITPEGRAFLDWLERGAASANVPLAEPLLLNDPDAAVPTPWRGPDGSAAVFSPGNGCALECGVGFRQLRTCRRTRPGQLCANKRHPRSAMGACSVCTVPDRNFKMRTLPGFPALPKTSRDPVRTRRQSHHRPLRVLIVSIWLR